MRKTRSVSRHEKNACKAQRWHQTRGVDDLTISESLHSKNVSKVNSGFCFAYRARAVHNFVVWEDELISETDGSVVDERCAKGGQDERIEANDGFNHFKSKTEPENSKDGSNRKVQQIVAEVILLVGYSADSSI